MLRRISITVVFLTSVGLVACSSSPEGRYVMEGNDKAYLELKPIDAKTGTVSDSGLRTGVYYLRDNSLSLVQKSGEWIGIGYFRGSEIILNEYNGTKKQYRFIKQSGASVTAAQVASGGKLTTDKVQRAVDKALASIKQGGTAMVLGIQENPQDNSARADIRFDHFQYDNGAPYVGKQNYSGNSYALLSHYNDGRWVLIKVQLLVLDAVDTNVEVE